MRRSISATAVAAVAVIVVVVVAAAGAGVARAQNINYMRAVWLSSTPGTLFALGGGGVDETVVRGATFGDVSASPWCCAFGDGACAWTTQFMPDTRVALVLDDGTRNTTLATPTVSNGFVDIVVGDDTPSRSQYAQLLLAENLRTPLSLYYAAASTTVPALNVTLSLADGSAPRSFALPPRKDTVPPSLPPSLPDGVHGIAVTQLDGTPPSQLSPLHTAFSSRTLRTTFAPHSPIPATRRLYIVAREIAGGPSAALALVDAEFRIGNGKFVVSS